MELAYTIRYVIMAHGLGMFVPWQERALLGCSDFGWKPQKMKTSGHIFNCDLVFASQLMNIMETAVRLAD
jgi:hypothetical protein